MTTSFRKRPFSTQASNQNLVLQPCPTFHLMASETFSQFLQTLLSSQHRTPLTIFSLNQAPPNLHDHSIIYYIHGLQKRNFSVYFLNSLAMLISLFLDDIEKISQSLSIQNWHLRERHKKAWLFLRNFLNSFKTRVFFRVNLSLGDFNCLSNFRVSMKGDQISLCTNVKRVFTIKITESCVLKILRSISKISNQSVLSERPRNNEQNLLYFFKVFHSV